VFVISVLLTSCLQLCSELYDSSGAKAFAHALVTQMAVSSLEQRSRALLAATSARVDFVLGLLADEAGTLSGAPEDVAEMQVRMSFFWRD
jgi:hypothetical protein